MSASISFIIINDNVCTIMFHILEIHVQLYTDLPTTLQIIVTNTSSSIPPTIPPNGKCVKKARKFSADQACSGGVNVVDILTNQSATSDVSITSRLQSSACSNQRCFNTYIKIYRECLIDLSGVRGNTNGTKLVRVYVN